MEERSTLARKLPWFKLSAYTGKVILKHWILLFFVMTVSLAEMNCGITCINGEGPYTQPCPFAEGFYAMCARVFAFATYRGGHFNLCRDFSASDAYPGYAFGKSGARGILDCTGRWRCSWRSFLVIVVERFASPLPVSSVYQNLQHNLLRILARRVSRGSWVNRVLHVAYSATHSHQYGLALWAIVLLTARYAVERSGGAYYRPLRRLQLTNCIAAVLHSFDASLVVWGSPCRRGLEAITAF
ncbi:hypothetical protein TcBrA4_0005250 [Trypanosoma cruzi]|nr:hypothetical protein TcBrA4_0005250 [Trypanosoma cruzi]